MIIEVKDLSKHFDYYKKDLGVKSSLQNLFRRKKLVKKAVKNVSFCISEGEIVGFLGPNGAGKTTTLKMLAGILYPSEGIATVSGYIPWERKEQFKKNFSIIMGQKSQLWWDLPAIESLNLNKYIYEINDKQFNSIVRELAELLKVKDLLNVQVRRLSLGQRMKMELIAALIHQPKIIFLDEPTIGLDVITQRNLRAFIKDYNQKFKTTIILTSHYMEDIEELCDRVIVINNGELVYDGDLYKINEIFNNKKLINLNFTENFNKNELSPIGNIRRYDDYNVQLEVENKIVNQDLLSILSQFPIKDFTIENIPIEESIELLYRKEGVIKIEKETKI
ncbi:ABC transporter ATP-binding protein [Bacillus tequilensis]|uniref:ABC transporter ATP-binding protein n=1 Tax=Bacillus tequilensis TaxID=227866 RepID=UPI001575D73E|nr:ATP-binding cassette domain-containing protein [Bacillus tequilensis]